VQSLADRANSSGAHHEWRLHLLGISGLSARTRSTDREYRSSWGPRHLDMRSSTRLAAISQTTRLGLQPHQPRSRHARRGSAFSLALCVSVHAQRPGFPCGIDARRWLALAVAETDRFPRCPEGVSLLYGPPACKTDTPHLAASAFRHQIQRTSTRRVLFR